MKMCWGKEVYFKDHFCGMFSPGRVTIFESIKDFVQNSIQVVDNTLFPDEA